MAANVKVRTQRRARTTRRRPGFLGTENRCGMRKEKSVSFSANVNKSIRETIQIDRMVVSWNSDHCLSCRSAGDATKRSALLAAGIGHASFGKLHIAGAVTHRATSFKYKDKQISYCISIGSRSAAVPRHSNVFFDRLQRASLQKSQIVGKGWRLRRNRWPP